MNQCIICKNTHSVPLYEGIRKCADCHHAFADQVLTDEELFKIYSRNYFFGEEYSDYFADKRVLQKNFLQRLQVLSRYLEAGIHDNLLEIGCAYGFFLDVARGHFKTVRGIDINADGVAFAKEKLGLDTIRDDFLKHDFGSEIFDVVCLWDTIEHLRDPHLYLEKIAHHTKKGSLIALTTGDIESINAKLRKENWRLIHPPTHLHYFSKKSIEKLLNQCGFEVVYNRHCGFYRSIDNIAYNIFVLRRKNKYLYQLFKKFAFDFYLNLFDIMYVIGRKK